jgi:hypothetical protein
LFSKYPPTLIPNSTFSSAASEDISLDLRGKPAKNVAKFADVLAALLVFGDRSALAVACSFKVSHLGWLATGADVC